MNLSKSCVPRPKAHPDPYVPDDFPESLGDSLGSPVELSGIGFGEVVMSRRSGNSFASIDHSCLGSLLWYSARTMGVHSQDPNRELRPVPSAGALHPLHLLLSESSTTWLRYISRDHALRRLRVAQEASEGLWSDVREVFQVGGATVILLLADLRRVSAYYHNPESLVLREAGCLLCHLGLVAEALGLSYRILGITGEPWASELIPGRVQSVAGVGVAIVGQRADTSARG
jgi:hypothetical protein